MATILFIAGLGSWPGLYQPIEARLARERPSHLITTHNPVTDHGGARRVNGDASPSAVLADLLDSLRLRVEQAAPPLTVVAQSLDATLALALALDDPTGIDALVLHEPLVGAHAPTLAETVNHASTRLHDASDPVMGVQDFAERLMGTDTWSRLHPSARGYTRHHADDLRRMIPPVANWSPDHIRPTPLTFVSAGAGSAPMWHRAAGAVAGGRGRHRTCGRGHLLNVDDPQVLVETVLVATDAAEGRGLAA